MDLDTREWFDGVLTAAARKVVKEPEEVRITKGGKHAQLCIPHFPIPFSYRITGADNAVIVSQLSRKVLK